MLPSSPPIALLVSARRRLPPVTSGGPGRHYVAMLSRWLLLLATISPLAALPLRAGGLLDFILGKPGLEVITVTEVTAAGQARPAAAPGQPVYYAPINLGYQELGGVVGGEKIPPQEDMLRLMTKVLAQQGYVPWAENTPPPSVVLVLSWGTLNTELDYGLNPDAPPRQLNRRQILRFLGGNRLGFSDHDFDPLVAPLLGLNFKSYDARSFYELAAEDLYIAIVAAYDFESVRRKQRQLLWVTKISCPSRGHWLGEVMPTMMSVAGPHLGRDTEKPVWVDVSEKFKPSVELKDLKILDYPDQRAIPPPAPAAKPPADK
jgi:hypothetical protein